MKYILDFDRTLFDVDTLYEQLARCRQSHLAGTIESFAHVAIADLLFSDVPQFLSDKKPADVYILSSVSGLSGQWETDYQTAKIAASGLAEQVAAVQVVSGEKGVAAASIAAGFPSAEPIVFVDDRIEHCLSVQAAVPEAHCWLIVLRPSIIGDRKSVQGIPVVHSLSEVGAPLTSQAR
jgi:NAD(P)-dependent dehydrogenase (short-subunit alcohol dehydrogenase family)